MKARAVAVLAASTLALAGCGMLSRANADRAQAQLRCGLTVSEVEAIVGGSLTALEPRDARVTHLYRDGFTDLRFIFENGRLQSSQVIVVVGLKGTREEPRIEHCQRGSA